MPKIIIDPGHGAKVDPGAVNGKFKESEIALAIAKHTEKELQNNYGLAEEDVRKTRVDETFKTLQWRSDYANKNKADLFISFHCNSAQKEAEGFETFTYLNTKKDSKTYELQELIHAECMNVYKRYGGNKDRGMKQADFHVIRETNMPAVLIEFAFISNAHDLKILTNKEYQKEVGIAVAKAIAAFLCLKKIPKKCPTCGK